MNGSGPSGRTGGPAGPGALCSTGATFSRDRHYRYRLWRRWDAARPLLLMLMLNPSTADATRNDPTVERCERRARAGGFGGLLVANLFALRSTDPGLLYTHPAPVGPANDTAILAFARAAGQVVCAWGVHGAYAPPGAPGGRCYRVASMLRRASVRLHVLGLTRDGHPRHPLYLSNATPVVAWDGYGAR